MNLKSTTRLEPEPNQTSSRDVVLQTKLLTKKFGRTVVVDQLSLNVERGDIFGFLGQNGAGKSTTMRMLLGLVRPKRPSALCVAGS
jgi:ABC-type multidrug transport system ATPase subunit